MSSIWTDLLFLHGYLIRKDDLAWRKDAQDTQAAQTPGKDVAEPANVAKTKAAALACCASVWPRIMTPR